MTLFSFESLYFVCSSDRYKIFIDLFNLASFLVPREFIPKLTNEMKICLSTASVNGTAEKNDDDETTN